MMWYQEWDHFGIRVKSGTEQLSQDRLPVCNDKVANTRGLPSLVYSDTFYCSFGDGKCPVRFTARLSKYWDDSDRAVSVSAEFEYREPGKTESTHVKSEHEFYVEVEKYYVDNRKKPFTSGTLMKRTSFSKR